SGLAKRILNAAVSITRIEDSVRNRVDEPSSLVFTTEILCLELTTNARNAEACPVVNPLPGPTARTHFRSLWRGAQCRFMRCSYERRLPDEQNVLIRGGHPGDLESELTESANGALRIAFAESLPSMVEFNTDLSRVGDGISEARRVDHLKFGTLYIH